MAYSEPTIVATSGGFVAGQRTEWAPGPLIELALELANSATRPRLCYIGTAGGDQRHTAARVTEAFAGTDVVVSYLHLFPMPNVADLRAHLLAQDVVWVGGGSVAGLLALWRLHELDLIFPEVWRAGVVLGGVSAGSLCWHLGGPTDSFGPTLRPITNGLGLLPYGNGVHYDSEEQRRPLLHRMVADGAFQTAYATEDGTGLVYRGTSLAEVVTGVVGKTGYQITGEADGSVTETQLEARVLPKARLGR